MKSFFITLALFFSAAALFAIPQQTVSVSPVVASVRVEPTNISAEIGQELHFTAVGLDAAGKTTGAPVTMWFTAPWDLGSSDANGVVKPEASGILRVGARVGDKVGYAVVMVRPLAITSVGILPVTSPLVAGGHLQMLATARDAKGDPAKSIRIDWISTDPTVATIDASGLLTALKPGYTAVKAEVSGVSNALEITVAPNPVDHLAINPSTTTARTGDVVRFSTQAHAPGSVNINNLRANWSLSGEGASIFPDGAFVAEQPGTYVITANIGTQQAVASVVVTPRQVQRELEIVAHVIPDAKVPYSEEWIFGDTAYLSTIGDKLYAYDISDPAHPKLSAPLMLDARLMNDVSVSADGRIGVITREGASTRKNGVAFLDTSDPLHPKPISEYTQTVTGGVHSAFLDGHYAYITDDATGSLRVLDFADAKSPREVARWELDNPIAATTQYPLGIISSGRFLHDVYVKDGLAYLSYWRDGLVILDVGNGIRNGSPEKPALVSQTHFDYHQPYGDGWNAGAHTAFRYKNYVFVGDEVLPGEYNIASRSRIPVQGIVHVLDVTDIAHPVEVASYAVPEAGAHNFWIADDLLYMGYYNGGGRILDVSGELRGDLYRQGREVARLATGDPDGFRPNLPMAWGGQPHKGFIYFNDINSGLWIVKLGQPKMNNSTTGAPN